MWYMGKFTNRKNPTSRSLLMEFVKYHYLDLHGQKCLEKKHTYQPNTRWFDGDLPGHKVNKNHLKQIQEY